MANTKSAEKRIRQNAKERERNRGHRSRLRTAVKSLRAAIEGGDAAKAQELLPQTLRIIDATAQKKIIHPNTASRYKSRLSKSVARAKS
ncbi:MAG TPA: 30S ribosomal protein S20 [Thermoanaerobaculia bacterium]|nr:30S ribosomal protein S20 [Thermoanaerobaculia bacterium]